jgi:hypothetical protein
MESSYSENSFDLVFEAIAFSLNPQVVVEVGLLEGFSLQCILKNVSKDCKVYGYDLFEDFPFNAAKKEDLEKKFEYYKNLTLCKNEYKIVPFLHLKNTVDIFHIDIANNGEVFKYCVENYLPRLNKNGIMILEGGSKERDEIEWMKKYKKAPINPYLESIKVKHNFIVLDKFPSLTIFKK